MRAALARGVNNSGSDSENLQLMTAFTKPSSVLSFEFETFVYIFNISANFPAYDSGVKNVSTVSNCML